MPGERRFAERLRALLEDDYLCWYDVPIGPRYQHPDFLILHPARGILVLEVKDWRLDTIRNADPMSFTIDTGAGHKVVASPLEQARQYAHAVVSLLQQDPQLIEPAGSPFEAEYIGNQLLALHSAGVAWNEIGIFYTAPFVADEIAAALDRLKVPFDWLKDSASKSFDPAGPSVKLMTPHSGKGLQFRVAVIGGAGFWPYYSEVDEARLLYVAMTRATHELVITSSKHSVFSERLQRLCTPLAA